MDRLLSLEPSSEVAIRVEPGERCFGELTLRNVMYTMPVAFRLQPTNRAQYSVRPQSGVIPPLAAVALEITYLLPIDSPLPDSRDSFLLDSVVVPGAASKDTAVPDDWFATRKKQVFTDSGVKVFFVGSAVLARLVAEGSMDRIREVLERSLPEWHAADSADPHGQTMLHLAVSQRRADIVQLLLEFDPSVDAVSRAGRTPLELAAAAGDSLIAELLLAHGASTKKITTSAWGPIHFAAAGGHAEVTELLLAKGADPNSVTSDGRTAMHLAAAEQRRECLRLLLGSGGRAEVRGGPDGDTTLHIAAAAGDEESVKLLVSTGCAGLKEVRNFAGRTAYEAAVERGHGKLFDALNLSDLLAVAARKGESGTAARAVERGAAVGGRDQNGWTPLMRAAFKGRVEVVKALLEKGAEVDARDDEGYAALHCAAEAGQADAVELLVKRGADLDARTSKGATAMRIAGSFGYAGIARILVQGGANEEDSVGVGVGIGIGIDTIAATEKRKVTMKGAKKKGSRLSLDSAQRGGIEAGGGLKGSSHRRARTTAKWQG